MNFRYLYGSTIKINSHEMDLKNLCLSTFDPLDNLLIYCGISSSWVFHARGEYGNILVYKCSNGISKYYNKNLR